MKHSILNTLICIPLIFSTIVNAETRFITDEFKVTLRTGSSTSNSILTMLKSGQAVEFIEQDEDTKYSLVQTKKGKKGYVLTRFLDTQPSGRELYSKLQQQSKQQKETINTLKSDLALLKQLKTEDDIEMQSLSDELNETADTLNQLETSTKNTVAIMDANETQKSLILQLEKEKQVLLNENNSYKDSTAMDWFVRGSAVTLIAFLMGIIVTRIRWKKRESWGDF